MENTPGRENSTRVACNSCCGEAYRHSVLMQRSSDAGRFVTARSRDSSGGDFPRDFIGFKQKPCCEEKRCRANSTKLTTASCGVAKNMRIFPRISQQPPIF